MIWRAWKTLRAAAIFTAFYLGATAYGLSVLPFIAWRERDPVRRIRQSHRAVSQGFVWTMDLMRYARLIDFDSRSVQPHRSQAPAIVIANHPSTLDVVGVLSVYREACVLVKHTNLDHPLLRPLFRWCGHIPTSNGDLVDTRRMLDEVAERLAQGFDVVIFPEGTRSPPGDLGTLHKGAFAVVSQTQSDLVPVLVTCEPPAFHKEAPWHCLPRDPVHYAVTPGAVISGKQTTARRLQRTLTAHYREVLGLPLKAETGGHAPAPSGAQT